MKKENKSSKETREKIIRATIELLEENGYIGTTTQAICERAKVAAGRINYHFGSKDELIIYIAEMIPTKVRKEVALRLNHEYKNNVFLNSMFFDALLIKIIYTDNKYMEIYREIYSQNFICNHIADDIKNTYLHDVEMDISKVMITIIAEASAYAITSLAKESNYLAMKSDVESVIREICRFQLFAWNLDEKTLNNFLDEIIDFANSIEYEIIGITDINFL